VVKKALFIICFFLSCARIPAAEGYQISRIVFLPPSFYVGDEVELRINLDIDPGLKVKSPESLPRVDWMKFESCTVENEENKSVVRIRFSTFHPGTRTLPDIKLGDIILSEIKIHTESVLDQNTRTLASLRPQLFLPGTRLFLALFIAVVIVLPLLIILLSKWLKRFLSTKLKKSREGRINKRYLKELKKLKEKLQILDSRNFYIIFTQLLRWYLTKKTKINYLTSTNREMRSLAETSLEDGAITSGLMDIFQSGDLAKFGGISFNWQKKESDLKTAVALADFFEHRTAHVDT